MENAVGEVQNILVLGGRSEIGVAIARELLTPSTQRVTLACRQPGESQEVEASLARNGLSIESVGFDAADTASHAAFVDKVVASGGDLDVVILAFGVLGSQERCDDDAQSAVKIAHTNYTGAVSIAMEVAKRFRQQGHGRLIILSSVAGERTRKANYVYGSTKAGLDAFAQGLSDAMVGTGASVMIVRPGFVHSAMTTGMKAAPFSTTPDVVAKLTVKGLRAGKRIVWTPGILRWVFMVMRHLPVAIWRRMPMG
jgi:decaprenylphospho-beta-D-erythro-pentofuranosid-2-ulose 2-reductase